MIDIVPSHPGAVLDELFVKPLDWSVVETAERLGVSESLVADILAERRTFDADFIVRLARLFGTDEAYWFRFQNAFDAHQAKSKAGEALSRIEPYEKDAA